MTSKGNLGKIDVNKYMVGNTLLRYATDQKWLIWDIESNGLNLYGSLPWELSYAICSLKNGIESTHTHMIRWPQFRITEMLSYKTHFDKARYEAEAKPPEVVWEEFGSKLYSPEYRSLGHNLLGFDVYMIAVWRRLMGLTPDHSWIGGGARWPLIDTAALAKAYKKRWTPDSSSPDALLSWMYKCESFNEKGLKTKLGVMCDEFKIEYDEAAAHSSLYDIQRNWLVAKELFWKVEV